MSFDQIPYPGSFRLGRQVMIKDGTFVGMLGEVISLEQAQRVIDKEGGQQMPLKFPKGAIYVLIELFGRRVPVILQSIQLQSHGI
jgi:transcription antitermination factor NusG